MAATIVSRSVRGTSLRKPDARPNFPLAPNCAHRHSQISPRLDDGAFRALFAKSPVKRIGRDRFIRNVLIAIGNSNDASLAQAAERLLDDASPLVRGAAVWALSQLVTPDEFAALAKRARASETDAAVRAEWMDCAAHP